MAKNKEGKKKAAKGDKKAARRSVRKAHEPKIKGSKEHRGCGPIGRKLRAENIMRIQRKGHKFMSEPEQDAVAASYYGHAKRQDEKEMSEKASSQLYKELLNAWS